MKISILIVIFLVRIADGQPLKIGERWEWKLKIWWLVKGSNRCSFVNFQFIFDPLSRWAKGLKDGQRQHSCPSVRILTNLSKVSKSSLNQQEIGNTDTDKAEERWTDTKFVDNKILLPNPKASGNTLDLQLVKTVRPYERQTKLTNAMTVYVQTKSKKVITVTEFERNSKVYKTDETWNTRLSAPNNIKNQTNAVEMKREKLLLWFIRMIKIWR